MPNDRWDDFAIDNFVQSVRDYMTATAALPTQIAKLASTVESNSQRIGSHHDWIEQLQERNEKRYEEVKTLCERIGKDIRDDRRERARNAIQIVIAIISAAAIVAAAIITST